MGNNQEELERAILGAILIDQDVKFDFLREEWFENELNSKILHNMKKCSVTNIISLTELLPGNDVYISSLAASVTTGTFFKQHVADLINAYKKRLMNMPYYLAKYKVEELDKILTPTKSGELVLSMYDKSPVYTWGTSLLDNVLQPISPKSLIVLVGAAGSGKTAYGYFVARKNAENMKALYISLEMDSSEMRERLAMTKACITKNEYRLRSVGGVPQRKLNIFDEAIRKIQENKNLIIEGFTMGTPRTLNNIFTIIKQHSPDLVFIDNLNTIALNNGESELDGDKRITAELSAYAKDNILPIILIHHANKTGDVRGSQKIKDNVDMMILIDRSEEAKEETPEKPCDPEEKAKLYVRSVKERLFGGSIGAGAVVYFNKGDFYQEYIPDDAIEIKDVKEIFGKTIDTTQNKML